MDFVAVYCMGEGLFKLATEQSSCLGLLIEAAHEYTCNCYVNAKQRETSMFASQIFGSLNGVYLLVCHIPVRHIDRSIVHKYLINYIKYSQVDKTKMKIYTFKSSERKRKKKKIKNRNEKKKHCKISIYQLEIVYVFV